MKHNRSALRKVAALLRGPLLLACVAGLALSAGTPAARGQVAATSLLPIAPVVVAPGITPPANVTATADNPAAMSWAEGSVAGAGQITGSRTTTDPSTGATSDADMEGLYGGLRWNQEELTLAAEQIRLESSSSGYDYREESTNLAASYAGGEKFSVGAGIETNEVEYSFITDSIQNTVLGISFKVGKDWYLGYALGREDFGRDYPAPTEDVSADRNVTMFGLAYRKGKPGRDGFYFEAGIIDKENYAYQGAEFGGYRQTTVALQAQLSVILAGYTLQSIASKVDDSSIGGSAIDLAYVPKKDLSIGVRLMGSTETDDNGDETAENDFTAITLAYLF